MVAISRAPLAKLQAYRRRLDLVPKGRDEQGLPSPMAWVRRHDEYEPR